MKSLLLGVMLLSSSLDLPVTELVKNKTVAGIVAASIQNNKVEIVVAGEDRIGSGISPDENSVFEIASLSKAFTGILVAQAVSEGQISLSDEVQRYLPGFSVPRGNRSITIRDLVTHTSGIANGFGDFKPVDETNPWAGFGPEQVKEFLKSTPLQFSPGTKHAYSNIGAALTGYILENVYAMPYETLVTQKILAPLGMKNSAIQLSDQQMKRMVTGYYKENGTFHPVPAWDMSGVPAAGALRSTLSDLILFTRGIMGEHKDLAAAFRQATSDFGPGPHADSRSGIFWILQPKSDFVWHNGATYGKTSFLGINSKKKRAIILLTNTCSPAEAETILGLQVMRSLSEN